MPIHESLGLPSVELVLKMVTIHMEAIHRCKELSYPLDM
jgi:hypothetical protein